MKTWDQMTPAEQRAWNLQQQAPAVTVDQRQVLASGQASVPTAAMPFQAGGLQWSAPERAATECVLHVGPMTNGTTFRGMWFPAEVPSQIVCLEVEYGAANTRKTLRLDVRDGTYQLPSCSFVRASIIQEGAFNTVAMSVPMALVSGTHGHDEFTYTMAQMPDGVYTFPRGARSVDVINPGRIVYTGPFGSQVKVIQETTAAVPLVSPPWAPVELPDMQSGVTQFTWTNEPVAALLGMCSFKVWP